MLHSHNNNLRVQELLGRRRRDPGNDERFCDLKWLQTACRLPAIIYSVSVATTEWYTSRYYARRGYGDIELSVPGLWQYSVWRIHTEKAIISLGNAVAMGNIIVASYVRVSRDG